MIVIGIDCATDPKKVGIALADCDESKCALVAIELGGPQGSHTREFADPCTDRTHASHLRRPASESVLHGTGK
jgi:hypothetical protein